MLKNKRNISIIAIALIVIIGSVYVGCSKTTDMQTTPEPNGKSLSVASSEEEPFVIPIIIRKEYYDDFFVENFKKLPSEMYFINSILAGYKSGEIWFNNEHRGKELINEHAWTNHIANDNIIEEKYNGNREDAYKGYKDQVIARGGTVLWDINKIRLVIN